MNPSEILQSASDTINTRNSTHGDPKDNLQRSAMLISAYLETPIHTHQVAVIQMLMKISRSIESPYVTDHWVDMAGYTALAGSLALDDEGVY